MILFKMGDILSEDAEALVNTVNCIGIMGRGIALQFKRAFPENFHAYAEACRHGEVRPGRMFVFRANRFTNPRFIINFPTKRHWRNKSSIEDIEVGLKDLTKVIRTYGIKSIAIPPLGSDLGGLDWSDVHRRIELALYDLEDVKVVVFEPWRVPESERMARSRDLAKMTPGRAALIGLMDHYLSVLLDPFVTLLEVHKLMYFLQASGERLRLSYTEGPYGPYAENLRLVLNEVEGQYISGFGEGSERPDNALKLAPGAVKEAKRVLQRSPGTQKRFERVANLVSGFESAFGLELLATVHWILERDRPASPDELIEKVYNWNQHKKDFSSRQIILAADVLVEKGWISLPTALR